MVLRWGASAFLITEKNFRKIQGYRDLWMLKAVLNPTLEENQVNSMEQVAENASHRRPPPTVLRTLSIPKPRFLNRCSQV